MSHNNLLLEKLHEAVKSVIPIVAIVCVLVFTIVPISTDIMLAFVIGSLMLILGLGIFMFGSENSMTLIGNHVGSAMTKSRKLWYVLVISFIIGVIITVAEPDLQVLAGNVSHINTMVLIITVSIGVGIFLTLCMVRILMGIQLKWLLIFFYGLIFVLAYLSDPDYISVAFDSGGVTTGPMTAPFIIAMGVGVASIRSDKNAESDSFGLVALCSIGPILAVLILGFFYPGESGEIAAEMVQNYADTVSLGLSYYKAIPTYMSEVAMALLPILIFFLLFQKFALHLKKQAFTSICIGLIFTYIGLVIFLTGVNVGFSALGLILGQTMGSGWRVVLTIPVFALIGWFVVQAEPAVHVLTKQVEEVSAGAVTSSSMLFSLSLAIAAAMALSMIRVLTGISILWFVVPGYALALILSFFVPPIFTAIAFDSGGVASGPMSATFMLPFAMGVCQAVGGNILTDAFGTVALVAMMPLITVQIMGVKYMISGKKEGAVYATQYSDLDVIELWD